jgi:hypothetical protein
MTRTDGITVPISARCDHGQVRVGEFHSDRRGKQSSVQRVDPVTFQIVVNRSRATDAPNDHCILGFDTEIGKGFLRRGKNTKIAASRTPDRCGNRNCLGHFHALTLVFITERIAPVISFGLKELPSNLVMLSIFSENSPKFACIKLASCPE